MFAAKCAVKVSSGAVRKSLVFGVADGQVERVAALQCGWHQVLLGHKVGFPFLCFSSCYTACCQGFALRATHYLLQSKLVAV